MPKINFKQLFFQKIERNCRASNLDLAYSYTDTPRNALPSSAAGMMARPIEEAVLAMVPAVSIESVKSSLRRLPALLDSGRAGKGRGAGGSRDKKGGGGAADRAGRAPTVRPKAPMHKG